MAHVMRTTIPTIDKYVRIAQDLAEDPGELEPRPAFGHLPKALRVQRRRIQWLLARICATLEEHREDSVEVEFMVMDWNLYRWILRNLVYSDLDAIRHLVRKTRRHIDGVGGKTCLDVSEWITSKSFAQHISQLTEILRETRPHLSL